MVMMARLRLSEHQGYLGQLPSAVGLAQNWFCLIDHHSSRVLCLRMIRPLKESLHLSGGLPQVTCARQSTKPSGYTLSCPHHKAISNICFEIEPRLIQILGHFIRLRSSIRLKESGILPGILIGLKFGLFLLLRPNLPSLYSL